VLGIVSEAVTAGQSLALCIVVKTNGAVPRHAGAKMVVFEDGCTEGTVGGGEIEVLVHGEALESLKDGKTRLLRYDSKDLVPGNLGTFSGEVMVYVEPYLLSPATIVVVGAGHVGRAIVHLAKWMGYRVVVSDDRGELCTPEEAPGGDSYLVCPMSQIPEKIRVDSNTFFVLVTCSAEMDIEGLPALLETEAGHIGLIGSQRRWAHCQETLLNAGLTKETLQR